MICVPSRVWSGINEELYKKYILEIGISKFYKSSIFLRTTACVA